MLRAGAGFKCHLGGTYHACCENDGEGPTCYWSGNNGCNPNSLNLGKECDETVGGSISCTADPTIIANTGGMGGQASGP